MKGSNKSLTLRELAVLRKLPLGYTNKEIAKALNITAHTVKAHLDNIYAKSNAHGKVAAVNYGLKHGLFD